MAMRFELVAAAAVFAAFVSASRAEACSGTPGCTSAWLFPVGGPIPSDRFTITYYSGDLRIDGGVALPRLTRSVDGGVIDVPFDALAIDGGLLKLQPREVQPVGATLRLEREASTRCTLDGHLSEDYHVIAPPPLPSALGRLRAEVRPGLLPLGVLPDRSCWDNVASVYADLRVELDPSAALFASRLIYGLVVDGRPLASYEPFQHPQAKPWSLKGSYARIYATCEAGAIRGGGLEPGTHLVHMEAQLEALTLSTPEIEVDLRCPSESARDAGQHDGGVPPTLAADAASSDASRADGSAPQADDGATVDSVMDDGGCRVASTTRSNSSLWMALAFLLRRRGARPRARPSETG